MESITLSLAPGEDGEESVCDVNKLFLLLDKSSEVSDDDEIDEDVLG